MKPCASVRNALLFVASDIGGGFYGFGNRKNVSFYQLEGDQFIPDTTFSGFGRYALFRVMNPSTRVRVGLDLTATLRKEYGNKLPPARVSGTTTVAFPLIGKGSARVFSPPVQSTARGQDSRSFFSTWGGPHVWRARPGTASKHSSVGVSHADPRYLTSYVRDVSLVSDAAFDALQPPQQIQRFPTGLTSNQLAYSGIYEDGWVGKDVVCRARGRPRLDTCRAGERSVVSVRGSASCRKCRRQAGRLTSREARADRVSRACARYSRVIVGSTFGGRARQRLRGTDDIRSAAARLTFLGLVSPPAAIDGVAGLRHPGLVSTGIDQDGWLRQRSTSVLGRGGRGTFVLRAQVPPLAGGRAQRVRVLVDGRPVASQRVQPGPVEIRAPAAASPRARRVTVVWAGVTRLAGNDPREAAARLAFLGFVREYAPKLVRAPADLADPRLSFNGIYKDGWLQKRAQFLLAGGASGNLTLRTQTPRDNRLIVLVNGKTVVSRAVKAGVLELKAAIPPSSGPRQIQAPVGEQRPHFRQGSATGSRALAGDRSWVTAAAESAPECPGGSG